VNDKLFARLIKNKIAELTDDDIDSMLEQIGLEKTEINIKLVKLAFHMVASFATMNEFGELSEVGIGKLNTCLLSGINVIFSETNHLH
jgi:hypothetical protein